MNRAAPWAHSLRRLPTNISSRARKWTITRSKACAAPMRRLKVARLMAKLFRLRSRPERATPWSIPTKHPAKAAPTKSLSCVLPLPKTARSPRQPPAQSLTGPPLSSSPAKVWRKTRALNPLPKSSLFLRMRKSLQTSPLLRLARSTRSSKKPVGRLMTWTCGK